jgi:hypothetical protein
VAVDGQTFGLEEIILHHSFKHLAGKTVRIPCRERTHLSGDNGAGKTSILSLIPVFYGEEPERLVSKAGSKDSFLEFYLKTPQSMVVFEYTQFDGCCCVVLYRHKSNKVCYRFIKGAADETIFSEAIADKLRNGATAQEAIDLLKDAQVRVSRQIMTIQDYRAIIQRDPELIRRKGADTSALRAEALEFGLGGPGTQMRFIHKLAHVVLNKNSLMGNFKTMICETMFQNIHLNSAPVSLDAGQLIAEINSLKAFSRETDRIRECLVKNSEREKLLKEGLQVKMNLVETLDLERGRLSAKKDSLGKLKFEIELLENEFESLRRERLSKIAEANANLESIEKQLAALHDKYSEYEQAMLSDKVEALKTLPDLDRRLSELRALHEQLTQKVERFKTEFANETARLKTGYGEWMNHIRNQQTNKEKLRDGAKSQMETETEQLRSRKAEEALAYISARQSAQEGLISTKAALETQIKSIGFLESEQELLTQASAAVEEADESKGDCEKRRALLTKNEDAEKVHYDTALKQEQDAKQRLNDREAEKVKLSISLNPEPGTWLHALREKDPHWGVTLGRLVNTDLLERKDLSPTLLNDGESTQVFGWSIDLAAVETPSIAEDESKIRERTERAIAAVTRAINVYDDAKKHTTKAATEHKSAATRVDEARIALSTAEQVLSSRKRSRTSLKFELDDRLKARKSTYQQDLNDAVRALERYKQDTKDGISDINNRFLEEEREKIAHWQNVIQGYVEEMAALQRRLEDGKKEHETDLESRHQAFLQSCSDEGIDATYVANLKKGIEQMEGRRSLIIESREIVDEYQRWLSNDWSFLNELNSRFNSARGLHNKLYQENRHEEDAFTQANIQRTKQRRQLVSDIELLKSRITDADNLLARFQEEPPGVDGHPGDIISLTTTLREHLARLDRLKKEVHESFRSAKRVIQNYDGTQIHQTWEEIMAHRNVMMPEDYSLAQEDQSMRHVEGLRLLLDSNIPQLEAVARERFSAEAGKLVAYFEGLLNLTTKVRAVASKLDTHINTDQQIESLENIRIILTPKIQDDMSWKPLKDFTGVWRDWSSVNSYSLPNDDVLDSFKMVQYNLRDAKLSTDIKSMIDLHISMTEGGTETIIRSEIDFEESSSKGLSYLAIMVIFMGMTRYLCPDKTVRIIWPVDELATLSNNNIPKLAEMLEKQNLTMMSACPDLSRALSQFFENKLGVLPGRIVQYTDDQNLMLSETQRSELKRTLAFREDATHVV